MKQDPVSLGFAALADPTRRAILAHLLRGEASVGQLAAPFDLSLPAITKHLKVLEKAGLISRSRNSQWRPCHIEPQGFQPVVSWLSQMQRQWEQRLDRLEEYLKQFNEDELKN
ncbi:MAG: metalloregulator ArsR/SmtB family transcription factor [bacterium]|nr:metalloregulator ArsR/SmtB family transcription factor [bacterium]